MKKLILIVTVLCSISFYAQTEIKITTKKCIPKKGYYLQLKKVLNDSRCPEGVNCVWAGEVSVTINVYNEKKFIEEKIITINSKNRDENFKWIQDYYPRKVKGIEVEPYPKEGDVIQPKKYYLKIRFSK